MLGPAVLASCVAQLAMRPTFVTFGDSITQRGFAPGWTGQLADAYQRRVDVLNRGERVGAKQLWRWLAVMPETSAATEHVLPLLIKSPLPCIPKPAHASLPPHPPSPPSLWPPPAAGYSGYNSRWALQLMDRIFPANAPAPPPQLVTIFFGANDAALPDRGS